MRIPVSRLANQLARGIPPACLVFGAEPLLIEEALDMVRGAARQAGFSERLALTAETDGRWVGELAGHLHTRSLFASRKLVELRLPANRLSEDGARMLTAYLADPAPDNVVLVSTGKLDRRRQGAGWCKALENAGLVVEAPSVRADQMPGWVARRLTAAGVVFQPGVAQRLTYLAEGNLLAAAQEIDKLALLAGTAPIDVQRLDALLIDYARFTAYAYVDACLKGDSERSLRILASLRREGLEPVLVLWTLARDIRQMTEMAARVSAGAAPAAAIKHAGVWVSRVPLVAAALGRLAYPRWQALLVRLAWADRLLKGRPTGVTRGGVWDEIEDIGLAICGVQCEPHPGARAA